MINATLDIDYSDLHHGKYDCPMAQFISLRIMGQGEYGEDEYSDESGEGFTRYGRRVFYWDDRGFVYCDTYDTVEEAEGKITEAWARISELQNETCAEQGCTACRYCESYECGACLAGSLVGDSGSSHVDYCERNWIG